MLLSQLLPALIRELEQLLRERGELALAEQVPALVIMDRCRCGDTFCASFYVAPSRWARSAADYRCMYLNTGGKEISLGIAVGRITYVEVLHRDSVRKTLIDFVS